MVKSLSFEAVDPGSNLVTFRFPFFFFFLFELLFFLHILYKITYNGSEKTIISRITSKKKDISAAGFEPGTSW